MTADPQIDPSLFDRTITPDFLEVRELSLALDDHLATTGISADELHACSIATTEALNNIVEHGFAQNAHGKIRVEIACDDDLVRATLTDTGRAMPGFQLPEGAAPDPTDLPEGGFGWFMIKTLTSDQIYERKYNKNILILEFSRKIPA